MGERMRKYLRQTEELADRLEREAKKQADGKKSDEEKEIFRNRLAKEKEELLIQIGFFQHERLIHLIVTVLFALLTVLVFLFAMTEFTLWMGALLLLLLVLLIPYIRHYYLLENGTQKLYLYYDKLEELYNGK